MDELAHILGSVEMHVSENRQIITIDLQYLGIPEAIAAYVLVGTEGEPVLIETGPASTLSALERGLAVHGFKLADIRHALVTHIHLDHAGAAGHLARNGTQIYVHEIGAKHLIDPSKLIESATRIYRDQMQRLWGDLLPVPKDRVTPLRDGDVVEAGGMKIDVIQTSGHARHHHAFAVDTNDGRVCFAGDAAGICVPGVPEVPGEPPQGTFISVPTPPPEFDLEAWLASIDRMMSMDFARLYLTHFGVRRNVRGHLELLRELVPRHAEFVRSRLMALGRGAMPREKILGQYIEWNRAEAADAGVSKDDFDRYVSRNLLTMNVDGLIRYWTKSVQAR